MYRIPKQSYTTEFKQEAVRQVEIEGKSPAQVARDLGIAEQTLGNWRKAYKAGKLQPGTGKPVTPDQMELSKLRFMSCLVVPDLKPAYFRTQVKA